MNNKMYITFTKIPNKIEIIKFRNDIYEDYDISAYLGDMCTTLGEIGFKAYLSFEENRIEIDEWDLHCYVDGILDLLSFINDPIKKKYILFFMDQGTELRVEFIKLKSKINIYSYSMTNNELIHSMVCTGVYLKEKTHKAFLDFTEIFKGSNIETIKEYKKWEGEINNLLV